MGCSGEIDKIWLRLLYFNRGKRGSEEVDVAQVSLMKLLESRWMILLLLSAVDYYITATVNAL